MKWSILIDVPSDNINDFFNDYVKDGSIVVRNEFVKGIIICDIEQSNTEEECAKYAKYIASLNPTEKRKMNPMPD